jgi:uncharacterized protein
MSWFFRKVRGEPEPKPEEKVISTLSDALIDHSWQGKTQQQVIEEANARTFLRPPPSPAVNGFAMDGNNGLKAVFNIGNTTISPALISWYASQGFITYQLCAIFSQHWLIDKACTMPGEDATRKGYEITSNDGNNIDSEVLETIQQLDIKYNLNKHLVQFVRLGRVFGIRIAMFVMDVENLIEYYERPFNPDGIIPHSYKGITQIDPYWITPELSNDAAMNPAAMDFYEPTWWRVNGMRIHRTHLIMFRTCDLPDILKPTYFYGGVPVPQRIYERVYAAERTANEAPLLALTKRLNILKTDTSKALAKQAQFEQKIQQNVFNRDNYGVWSHDLDEEITQFDTSLNDLDAVIMTQYQIVASAANVPVTKLMGTTPKGFNSTGEYEEASYHEELEKIQAHDLTPLIERHHLLLIRSEIAPKFNISPFETRVRWLPLDSMTAKEQAEVNNLNANTDTLLHNMGSITGEEARGRIINDLNSGYNGLEAEIPDDERDDLVDEEQARIESDPESMEI